MNNEALGQDEIAELIKRMKGNGSPANEDLRSEEHAMWKEEDKQLFHEELVKPGESSSKVMFEDISSPEMVDPLGSIDHLGHVNMELEIVLGEAMLTVGDLVSMTKDTVIPLKKLVGDNALILANGRALAEGEIVVLNDRFAFRVHSVEEKKKATSEHEDAAADTERNDAL